MDYLPWHLILDKDVSPPSLTVGKNQPHKVQWMAWYFPDDQLSSVLYSTSVFFLLMIKLVNILYIKNKLFPLIKKATIKCFCVLLNLSPYIDSNIKLQQMYWAVFKKRLIALDFGIPHSTILFWKKEYGLITAGLSFAAARLYTYSCSSGSLTFLFIHYSWSFTFCYPRLMLFSYLSVQVFHLWIKYKEI